MVLTQILALELVRMADTAVACARLRALAGLVQRIEAEVLWLTHGTVRLPARGRLAIDAHMRNEPRRPTLVLVRLYSGFQALD